MAPCLLDLLECQHKASISAFVKLFLFEVEYLFRLRYVSSGSLCSYLQVFHPAGVVLKAGWSPPHPVQMVGSSRSFLAAWLIC